MKNTAAAPEHTNTPTNLKGVILSWSLLRVLTSLLAAYASFWVPITEFEQKVRLWPLSSPWVTWLRRVLLVPWDRWDVSLYSAIASQGYRVGDGTTQFHPLYPWLAAPLARLTGDALFPLLLISSLAGIWAWVTLFRLARMDLPGEDARFAGLLWACFPVAFVLFAPYSEALFLLWAILCFLQARQKRWWLAGGCGLLAVLTRQQGILLILPLMWEIWYSRNKRWQEVWQHPRDWAALLLLPLAFVAWIAYRGLILSDVLGGARDFQSFVYSVLISSDAQAVVPVQGFFWPWQVLSWAVRILSEQWKYQHVLDLGLAALFVILVAASWRYLRPSYRLYTLAVLIVSLSYYTGPIYPYLGLPRHLWLGFPVFIGVSQRVQKRRSRILLLTGNLLLMSWMVTQYVFHVWVP